MFNFAIFLGIYSYSIFFLGIIGFLQKGIVATLTIFFFVFLLVWYRKQLNIFSIGSIRKKKVLHDNVAIIILFLLYLLQVFVNLLGAFSPELSFDALWYHLTLPKLYLQDQSVYFIPGGLLYYSAMPKLGEMLYVSALSIGNEITVKALHLLFGVFTTLALYKLTRKYYSQQIAFIAVVIFYSNLVVAWESTTAYIDLIRTFYEIMALWGFVLWYESRKRKWLVLTALMTGFAITTKLLALGSVFIFLLLIFLLALKKHTISIANIKDVLLFAFIALLVPLPWLVFAFVYTGNPVYPIFSDIFQGINTKVFDFQLLNPFYFITTSWNVLIQASDPISPIYVMFLPLLIFFYPKFTSQMKVIALYTLGGFLVWYSTSQVEGSRLLLPYLPACSLFCAAVFDIILRNKNQFGVFLPRFLLAAIIFVSLVTIAYRSAATIKYLPVLTGQQTKHEFLTNQLNFPFGDFYDTDNYFKNTIKDSDTVLLYGFHNLYYVDFPFIDSSWVKQGDTFNYIAVQNGNIPDEYKDWQMVYTNAKTMLKLYRPPQGVCNKVCVY